MSIFDEAIQLTAGDRREAYGPVDQSFKRVAHVWTGILGPKLNQEITAGEVALLMAGLKLCREANSPKRDNRVDAAAYIFLKDQIEDLQKG